VEGSIEALLSVDPAGLCLDDQLTQLAELDTLLSRVSARRERCLAAVADPGDQHNWIREEVACLLRWSFGTAAGRLIQAEQVVRRLPAALDAHEAGTISGYHLRILFELTLPARRHPGSRRSKPRSSPARPARRRRSSANRSNAPSPASTPAPRTNGTPRRRSSVRSACTRSPTG